MSALTVLKTLSRKTAHTKKPNMEYNQIKLIPLNFKDPGSGNKSMYNPGLPNKSQEFLFLQKREQWVRSVEEDVWGEITTSMDLTLAGWRAFDQSAHFLLKENLQRQCTFES